jgi:hypothetical protein
MNVTNNENDRHILLIIASGLAFLAWVIFEPTMGQCNSAGIYYPIGRVVIFWCWLFYLYFKRAKHRIWSWKNFLGGSFSGGWLFAIAGVIIYFFSNFSSDWSFQQKIQPLVWVAPYAMVSGVFCAFSSSTQKAVLSGVVILFAQASIDFILWLPWSCVY